MTDCSKKHRCEKASAPEDRLTSLPDKILTSILSFLPVKQRVALSAVCTRFRGLLSSIPRLDNFRLDIKPPFFGNQEFAFPHALIRQCQVVFLDDGIVSKPLEELLIDGLVVVGVQDLVVHTSSLRNCKLSDSGSCAFFCIKWLRSLTFSRIDVPRYLSPSGHTLLTYLRMEYCEFNEDLLLNLGKSCPFLETLQLIHSHGFSNRRDIVMISSSSIKHLVLLFGFPCTISGININVVTLESVAVDIVDVLLINAPKLQNASFCLALGNQVDPPDALKYLFDGDFPRGDALLILTSRNVISEDLEDYGIDEGMTIKIKFNLENQLSFEALIEFIQECKYCYLYDIHSDYVRIRSFDCPIPGSPEVELIDLKMTMPNQMFKKFNENQKEMTEKLKKMGLEKLRSRITKEQFEDILASEVSLFQLSFNCIEMKI